MDEDEKDLFFKILSGAVIVIGVMFALSFANIILFMT